MNPSEDDFQCFLAGISRYRKKQKQPEGSTESEWEVSINSECSHLSDGPEGGWHFGASHVQDVRIVRGSDGHRTSTHEYVLE